MAETVRRAPAGPSRSACAAEISATTASGVTLPFRSCAQKVEMTESMDGSCDAGSFARLISKSTLDRPNNRTKTCSAAVGARVCAAVNFFTVASISAAAAGGCLYGKKRSAGLRAKSGVAVMRPAQLS